MDSGQAKFSTPRLFVKQPMARLVPVGVLGLFLT